MNEYDNVLNEKDQEKRIDIVLTDAYDEYEKPIDKKYWYLC